MVNQELIDNIVIRFKQGEHSEQIHEDLQEEGYTAGDIDAAFRHIRYAALQQIPLIASFTNWLDTVDSQTANMPPRKLLMVFCAIGIIILFTATALYFIFDPLGTRASQRDNDREQAFVQLHNAIEKFNTDQHHYPKSLSDLSPNYIANIPVDPRTKQPYDYKIIDTVGNYQLCTTFETQNSQCISSMEDTITPAVADVQITPTDDSDTTLTLNGRVFIDANKNAKMDQDEVVVGEMKVLVTDSSGKQVCATTTGDDGLYTCKLQLQGNYNLSVDLPKGMKAAQSNPIVVAVPNKDYPITKAATADFGLAPATSSPVQSTPGNAVKK